MHRGGTDPLLKYDDDRIPVILSTKGKPEKNDHADRTPRETLEKRLEETPSNARCLAHSSSLMC